jgi:hypothetical protein
MKNILFIALFLIPCHLWSQNNSSQTPSLFDTWTAPAGIGSTFTLNDSMIIPLDIGILAEDDPHMQEKVHRGGKRAYIVRVVYDSARAKGRIFTNHGKNRSIGCMFFHIWDNGEASFHIGNLRRNGSYQSVAEADSASAKGSDRYEFHRYSNSSRIKMFEKLKDPEKISSAQAISLSERFRDSSVKKLLSAYPDSVSFVSLMKNNQEKIRVEEMVIEYLISVFFVNEGYNPRKVISAFHKFQKDQNVASKILESLKAIWREVGLVMEPVNFRKNNKIR